MTIEEKTKQIRLLALDVDGILTSGLIYYGNDEISIRSFHIHDGLGIRLLQKSGLIVAIITAKSSAAVIKRAQELNIEHVYLGQERKLVALEDLKNKLQIAEHEIAYMGDDLPDLAILRRVGLAITVPNAPALIKENVDIVTTRNGGDGAVREICEYILKTQGRYDSMIQSYLT